MIGLFVDVLSAAGVVTGAVRGRSRKLCGELSRLAEIGVAFLIGCGAFQWVGAALSNLTSMSGESSGAAGFVLTFFGSWFGYRMIRRVVAKKGRHLLRDWLDSKISEPVDRVGGAVAGGVMAGVLAMVGVGAAYLVPSDALEKRLSEDSFVGKAVHVVLEQRAGNDAEETP